MRTGSVALAALLLLSCSGPDQRSPDISIGNGWTREIAPGQSAAAVYVTIVNRGEGGDRLVNADAPTAGAATLHSSSSSGGVARMRAIEDGVDIPGHSTIEFKPSGTHIMLTGLKQPLRVGQTVALNLAFARSGRRSIAVRVVPATAGVSHAEHGMSM